MTHFLIVRHGETLWNRERRMQGQLDSGLSPAGHAQAQALGKRLADAGATLLVSSDLGRTVQTATPIAAATKLPLMTHAGLRERHFGIFQGQTPDEISLRHPQDYARWQAREPEFAMEGGESLLQLRARLTATLEDIAAQGHAKVILVTHGGALDAIYRIATSTPYETPRSWELANASINDVVIENGAWRMLGWADIAHLSATSDDFA